MPRIITIETIVRTRIEVEDHQTIESLRETGLGNVCEIFEEDATAEEVHSAHADAIKASTGDIVSTAVEHKILEGVV